MSEPPLLHCPACDTDNLQRIMGTGAGLIFKGSGFYLTDYKKVSSIVPRNRLNTEETGPAACSFHRTSSGITTDKK